MEYVIVYIDMAMTRLIFLAVLLLVIQARATPSGVDGAVDASEVNEDRLSQSKLLKSQSRVERDVQTECRNGEKTPNPDDCHEYYECENNKLEPDRCFWFRKFDVNELRCMWWGATCASAPKPTTEPVPTQSPTTVPTQSPTTVPTQSPTTDSTH